MWSNSKLQPPTVARWVRTSPSRRLRSYCRGSGSAFRRKPSAILKTPDLASSTGASWPVSPSQARRPVQRNGRPSLPCRRDTRLDGPRNGPARLVLASSSVPRCPAPPTAPLGNQRRVVQPAVPSDSLWVRAWVELASPPSWAARRLAWSRIVLFPRQPTFRRGTWPAGRDIFRAIWTKLARPSSNGCDRASSPVRPNRGSRRTLRL